MSHTSLTEDWVSSRVDEPLLHADNIQGNIIPGFNKDFQALLFLKIVKGKESNFKRWLQALAPYVTVMKDVLDFRRLLKEEKRHGEPPKVKATWINIAFSHIALQRLGALQKGDFKDQAFQKGLWSRSESLGDPKGEREGDPRNWVVGGPENEADVILIVASDDRLDLYDEVTRIEDSIYAPRTDKGDLDQSGVQIIFKQHGANLPGPLAGHEHFGFRDGVSQPGVRGLISEKPEVFLTPRQNPKDRNQGKPGQDLLWPGEFVFGYPGQDAKKEKEEPGDISDAGPSWARDGSFLVFRRLRQDVGAFHTFLWETARQFKIDAGLFGAKCVGRWSSGAPILRAPTTDNQELGKEDCWNNHFEFQGKSERILDSDKEKEDDCTDYKVDPSQGDPPGAFCPFAGHIRKTYSRDDVDENETQTHRLLRRGIPYGKSSFSSPHAPLHDLVDRGLLFLAYQTSIEEQFEFVQTEFANNPDFKEKGAGHDPIIGQNGKSPKRERQFRVIFKDSNGDEQEKIVTIATEWVIPTGGGYFFAPSLEALAWLASDVQEK